MKYHGLTPVVFWRGYIKIYAVTKLDWERKWRDLLLLQELG